MCDPDRDLRSGSSQKFSLDELEIVLSTRESTVRDAFDPSSSFDGCGST